MQGLFWISLSQIFLVVVNLIMLRILTEELSVKDFGFYTLCMAIVLFIRQIIYDPFSMIVAKEVSLGYYKNKRLSFNFMVVKHASDMAALLIALIGLFILGLGLILPKINNYTITIFFCSVYLFSNGAIGLYINVFNANRERKSASLFLIFDVTLRVVSVIFAIAWIEENYNIIFTAISFGSICTFLIIRLYVSKKYISKKITEDKIDKKYYKYIFMASPILFPTSFNALKNVMDRWILTGFIGLDALAAYSVLLQIGFLPIILIFGVIQTYIGPKLYEVCKSGEAKKIKNLLYSIIIITIMIGIIAGVLTDLLAMKLFDFFVSDKYKIYSSYLSLFAIAASITAGSGLLQIIIFGYFDTKKSSLIILLSSVSGLSLVVILTYLYDFIGAVTGLIAIGLVSFFVFGSVILMDINTRSKSKVG